MNYGFASLDPDAKRLSPGAWEEMERSCSQLYHHVATSVDLGGLDVLEIGCGRGGGCLYIRRFLEPRSVVGVDICRRAIALCNRHHATAGLRFSHGDAEDLPFPDSSFDAVINIESSHCYGSMARFLSEVYRVLRANGYLLLADLRGMDGVGLLRAQLMSCGLELRKEEVITSNVLAALERSSERKLMLIQQKVPKAFRGGFSRLAGIKGTKTYEALRGGRAEYVNYVLQKMPPDVAARRSS